MTICERDTGGDIGSPVPYLRSARGKDVCEVRACCAAMPKIFTSRGWSFIPSSWPAGDLREGDGDPCSPIVCVVLISPDGLKGGNDIA